MKNTYKLNLEYSAQSNPDQFEEFLDALLDAGIRNLSKGEKIVKLGRGGVNIECLSSILTDAGNGSKIRSQEFRLFFQADDSPTILLSYFVDFEGDEEEFKHWNFVGYIDSENNNDPSFNSYIDEFIYDLQPVDNEEDED
jgi:hypothetical protein